MVSSGVWARKIPLEQAYNLKSVVRGEDATMKSELIRIGCLGSVPCSFESTPMAAHFELHIEQGPILENEGRKIGIVAGVQAYRWFTIIVRGRDAHTGTTDLYSRADALLAASRMIVDARRIAHENGALASVGIIEAKPGSTNTIPGIVNFSLDVRARTDKLVDQTERALRQRFVEIVNEKEHAYLSDPVTHEWILDFDSPATHFHEDCINCVTEGSRNVFGHQTDAMTKSMFSGAGHDSVYTNQRVPTSMIFVPSLGGVSHNPSEWTNKADCATGAQVLLQAVLNYDQLRALRNT